MAVFKELKLGAEDDLKTLIKRMYQFSEELKFTFSNLDADNFSKEFIDHEDEKDGKVRVIAKNAETLQIRFDDLEKEAYAELRQSKEKIDLLVSRGSVGETMVSRMELYGDRIDLKTGHVIFDTDNFKLDAEGNAVFSGSITGGTMKIGDGFFVDKDGHAVIEGNLVSVVLNPARGACIGKSVTVEGEDGVGYCTVGGVLTGEDADIVYRLSCTRVKELSDGRRKERIRPVEEEPLHPVRFRFCGSKRMSMGFLAQELPRTVRRELGGHLAVSYGGLGALLVRQMQEDQKRLERIRKELERRENNVIL